MRVSFQLPEMSGLIKNTGVVKVRPEWICSDHWLEGFIGSTHTCNVHRIMCMCVCVSAGGMGA